MKYKILHKYWGYDSFRGIQEDIIDDILAGKDVLGLMPTGGGKSITFQVPAHIKKGVCVVVTPLIALMKDQVANLRKRHIRAAAIYSGMDHWKILDVLENTVNGGVDLLYVSPERLQSRVFQAKFKFMDVSFLVVDEAHCICQWGYDFRPAYLEISILREIHPEVSILALTATATPDVVKDIQEKLNFREFNCKQMSFARSNLSYKVQQVEDKQMALVELLQTSEGSAIVYTMSRDKAVLVAQMLKKLGISAEAYHAGLTSENRDKRQKQWTSGEVRVICATNAFGMGIDKPDVRLVVHFDCPDSIEAYFQEAGRGGRDGLPSTAILLKSKNEVSTLSKRIESKFPPLEYIYNVYAHLGYFYEIGVGMGKDCLKVFSLEDFCRVYHLFPIQVEASLKILTNAGYIKYEPERETLSRLQFLIDRDELYSLDEHLSKEENDVITSLLRNFTGLFSDASFIREEQMAEELDMTSHQVYATLVQLSHRHILRYIPRSRKPMVQFIVDRVDEDEFHLPPRAYNKLKERYIDRIKAMSAYISNSNNCRASMLLEYFGESVKEECGQCDVCEKKQKDAVFNDNSDDVVVAIMQKLADKKKHHISEFISIANDNDVIMTTVQQLVTEERIKLIGTMLQIK